MTGSTAIQRDRTAAYVPALMEVSGVTKRYGEQRALAELPHDHGSQGRWPIGAEQPPVLLHLPDEEAERTRRPAVVLVGDEYHGFNR